MNSSKWQSRRWIVTVWSMALLTAIVIWSIISQAEPGWLGILLPILGAVPSAYIAGDSYSKRFYSNS